MPATKKPVKLDIQRRTLPNGLELMALQSTVAPTVAIVASVELTQLHEPADKSGIVHLLGEAVEEGTQRYSGVELAELVEGYGGYLSVGGSGAIVQMAADDAEVAADILGEVILRPTFPAQGVRRAKDLTIADIHADLDDPRTVAGTAYRAKVYGEHPFARQSKGTIESVTSITAAEIRKFHAKWYTPDNTVIAGSGDVPTGEMLDLLEKTFRSWKGQSPEVPKPAEPVDPQKPTHTHLAEDRAQVQIFLGHLGIRRKDPDFYVLRVMDHVLGSGPGFTSRIARKLRDEQGLCYAVSAGITPSAALERGTFTCYIGTSPGQEEQSIRGFLHEMRSIRETLPSDQELADVKAYLTGSYVWGLERNSNLASFLLRSERFDLGDDYIERLPGLYEAVTAEQVREAAERHLHPDRYHLVTLGALSDESVTKLGKLD